ncbi:MAG: tRNA pseudouridine(55) synthase TruB [Dehalococcoidia bacterium]|nr:MAG: tRNA pseudouridine(55) synthase TruB [Dehalococcoidia bacterium]
MIIDGIFNINKPSGTTSFNIISIIRRLTGYRRVGHAGTLDPMASGVLPVCFGKGTKVIEFLLEASKVYRAQIELGTTTDTFDAFGNITRKCDYSAINPNLIEQSLFSFRGSIKQVPPMFSAIKYRGKRLYHFAREGAIINRQTRNVTIYRLELLEFKLPYISIEVECSRGTYIRSLAFDLGELLGCGAYLKNLIRRSYGPFDIEKAASLGQLEHAFSNSNWQQFVYPIDIVLNHLSSVVVNYEQEKVLKNGGSIDIKDTYISKSQEKRCRAYNKNGVFLAVLYLNSDRGHWQPQKVFA